jgi:signal transduction histidine kinase
MLVGVFLAILIVLLIVFIVAIAAFHAPSESRAVNELAEEEPAASLAPAVIQGAGMDRPATDRVNPSANGYQRSVEAQPGPRDSSRRALKNWRVRSRLFLLVLIPTVTAMMFGGLRIASAVQSSAADQRVEQLAKLTGKITGLVQALQNERQATVTYIVRGRQGGREAGLSSSPSVRSTAAPQLAAIHHDYAVTDGWVQQTNDLLSGIGSSYPAPTRQDAAAAGRALRTLPAVRAASTQTRLAATSVIQRYANIINAMLPLADQTAVGSSDATLDGTVRVASLVSQIKEEVSEQQALLTTGLGPQLSGFGQWSQSQTSAITDAQAVQQSDEAEFSAAATPGQRNLYNGIPGTTLSSTQLLEQEALAVGGAKRPAATDPTFANAAAGAATVVSGFRNVERRLVDSVISRSQTLRHSAITSAVADAIGVLLVLALALILTTIVGTSMVRPLRRLRAGALEVAGLRLPDAVRQMNETDGADVPLDVEPIDVDSSDEIGEVARAFDQVHREALRLAANEAALRGNVNAMFVNLSRRSQSLVERQIRLIDELEQGEQDSERLSSLFQMDHLATRMRRNSENLLVLAGHDVSRRWNQPVALVDVLRAAVSEIEQYERVTLNVQPGIAVRGQAVSDVVHLTAELVENATSFSPADTPVGIIGHLLSSGGVLLEIGDQGVGMGAEEMAHANWRLDNPPVVDVAVSRRMGLFVVARLAARHGIRVRLRPVTPAGLTALVWLPDEVVMHDSLGSSPGDRMFDSAAGVTGAVAPAATVAPEFADWGDSGRSAAEHEVNAARTPRFAPLRADAEDTETGQRRVPGAGLPPAADPWAGAGPAAGATGPLPAFRTSPQPAPRPGQQPDGDPQPATETEELRTGPLSTAEPRAAELARDAEPDRVAESSRAAEPTSAAEPSAAAESAWAAEPPAWGAEWGRVAEPASAAEPPAAAELARAAEPPAWGAEPGPTWGAEPAWAAEPAPEAEPQPAADTGDVVDAVGSNVGQSSPGVTSERSNGAAEKPDTGPLPVRAKGEPVGAGSSAGPDQDQNASGPGGRPVLGGPAGLTGAAETDTPGRFDWASGAFGGVVVPPAASLAEENRLPIFEAVESDWFRRGRPAIGHADEHAAEANGGSNGSAGSSASGGGTDTSSTGTSSTDTSSTSSAGISSSAASGSASTSISAASSSASSDDGWASPADEGWRAAEAVSAPTSSGVTLAGLPKRVPQANLVPGTAAVESPAPSPARSAAATRERLASFQRGIREARAGSADGESADGEGEDSS